MEININLIDIIFIINIIFAVIVLFFERHNPAVTLTWLFVLFFMPVIGFVLYIFFGQDLRKRRLFIIKREEEKGFNPVVEYQKQWLNDGVSFFKNRRVYQYLDMINLLLNSDQALLTQDNKVKVYNDGNHLFQHLLTSLDNAEKYIHIQSYIIKGDQLGREFLHKLVKKAESGIEVKVLYDGMGCRALPPNFFKPLLQAGGQVAKFFPPFLPYINLRINYRNHRKIWLIDGKEGFVGGFNIGDEYRGKSKKFGYWRDMHILIQGSAIDGLEERFLLDWRYAAQDESVFDDRYFPEREEQGNTAIQIVSSGPDLDWTSVKNGYLKLINKAQRNIYIQTPYFVPDDSILEALKIAALSGIDVKVMVPRKKDHIFVHWASMSYIGELLEAGARCYFYKPDGFLHSKVITTDGMASTVGTANLDIRSFKLNFEVNAFIYDEIISEDLETKFMRDILDCEEIMLDEYENRATLVRIKEGISRLISPLL